MDMISNEQKTGMTPSYDYPQAVFTPMPRLIEADYKLPTTGPWWYDGSDQAVDYRLTLGRLITNAGSSIKALMAETAMVNGKFPPQQVNFNNFADTYLAADLGVARRHRGRRLHVRRDASRASGTTARTA